jgi:aspartate 1-decarboxylase
MLIHMLRSKIHRAVVTETELEYEGSITIDSILAKKAGLLPFEKVLIANLRNGERLETYVIYGQADSGTVCMNGPAAHAFEVGDKVVIMSFTLLEEKKARSFRPRIIKVDSKNRPVRA